MVAGAEEVVGSGLLGSPPTLEALSFRIMDGSSGNRAGKPSEVEVGASVL